jgi:hypothetical protein
MVIATAYIVYHINFLQSLKKLQLELRLQQKNGNLGGVHICNIRIYGVIKRLNDYLQNYVRKTLCHGKKIRDFLLLIFDF